MSSLAILRRQIRDTETIRKVTHAMRLTSISTHTRLQKQKKLVTQYKHAIATLLSRVQSAAQKKIHHTQGTKTLYIIAGSPKGLCGTFNSQLVTYVLHHMPHIKRASQTHDVVALGSKLAEQLQNAGVRISRQYASFTVSTFVDITHELAYDILETNTYHTVHLIANYPHSFFLQRPEHHQLIPFTSHEQEATSSLHEYHWEQDAQQMCQSLLRIYVKARMQELLFQSLLAEQAARFISMDTATRNADDRLTTLRLDYNKIRQAVITRELADLTSGLL